MISCIILWVSTVLSSRPFVSTPWFDQHLEVGMLSMQLGWETGQANRWLQACNLLRETRAAELLANVILCNAATSACVSCHFARVSVSQMQQRHEVGSWAPAEFRVSTSTGFIWSCMILHDSQVTSAWYQALFIFNAMKDWFIQVDLLSLDLRSKIFNFLSISAIFHSPTRLKPAF